MMANDITHITVRHDHDDVIADAYAALHASPVARGIGGSLAGALEDLMEVLKKLDS